MPGADTTPAPAGTAPATLARIHPPLSRVAGTRAHAHVGAKARAPARVRQDTVRPDGAGPAKLLPGRAPAPGTGGHPCRRQPEQCARSLGSYRHPRAHGPHGGGSTPARKPMVIGDRPASNCRHSSHERQGHALGGDQREGGGHVDQRLQWQSSIEQATCRSSADKRAARSGQHAGNRGTPRCRSDQQNQDQAQHESAELLARDSEDEVGMGIRQHVAFQRRHCRAQPPASRHSRKAAVDMST